MLAGNAYAGTDSFTFTIDTALPTVSFSSSDSDNLIVTSDVVTFTANFSEVLTTTPTISISGTSITNQTMSGNIDSRAFIVLDTNFPNAYSGSVIYDKGANGNNFQFINGTQFITNSSENYLSFDGSNDYIRSVNHPNVTNGISGTDFTLLFRVKFINISAQDGTRVFTFNRHTGGYSNQFQIWTKNNGKIRVYMDGGGPTGYNQVDSSGSLTSGTWYNIALVKNGTSLLIYINGVLDSTTSVANRNYSAQYLYLGGNIRDSNLWNNMHLSKFQAYNTDLTLSEINQNFLLDSNSYKFVWDVDSGGALSEGTYSATVSASDNAGNAYVAGTQSITFTVDTTAPSVSLTNTDNNNKVNTSSVVTFTAVFSEALQGSPTITIPGIVTDTPLTLVSGTTWKYTWDTSSGTLAEGSHTVSITGQDPAGNSATVTSTFVVDTTVPTLSGLTNNDGNNTLNGTDTVTITATFNEPMNNSPTITIGNGVTDVAMTATSSTVWTYFLDMSSWSGSGSSAVVTVTGFDGAENSYAGTDSFTFNLDSHCAFGNRNNGYFLKWNLCR